MLGALLLAKFAFTAAVGSPNHTAIAATNGVVMNVWTDAVALHWRRFDPLGVPLDQHATTIAATPFAEPAVAANQDEFFIVWSDQALGLRGVRVRTSGDVVDSTPIVIANDGTSPAVASSGLDFLLAWSAPVPRGAYIGQDVFTAIFDRGGNALSPPVDVSPDLSGFNRGIEAVWTGSSFAVAWTYSYFGLETTVYCRFLAPNNMPLGSPIFVETGSVYPRPLSSLSTADGELLALVSGRMDLANRYIVDADGSVHPGKPLPSRFLFAVADSVEYAIGTAPLAALQWPFVAIADSGAIHVGSVTRRRTAEH